jgi:ElaB/YqjD/DUF883 family membrane-anchored ribosome-binding protein
MANGTGGKMNDDPNVKAAIIRDDIERTRSDMSRTVNEIEERLSPAHFKEQASLIKEHALEQFRDAKDSVKQELSRDIDHLKDKVSGSVHHAKTAMREATIGKVEHMAHETKRSIVDTIRDNPIPSAMIALGVGWLFMNRGSSHSSHYRARSLGYDDYGPVDGGFQGSHEGRFSSAAHRVKDGAEHLKEGASHLAERASDAVHKVADEARVLSSEARYEAGRMYRGAGRRAMQTERSVENTIRDNPLAAGAVLLAVGAAVGLSLPHTQHEDQWMGEAKERLVSKAQSAAHEAVEKVQEKAEKFVESSGSKNDTIKTEPFNKPNGSRLS